MARDRSVVIKCETQEGFFAIVHYTLCARLMMDSFRSLSKFFSGCKARDELCVFSTRVVQSHESIIAECVRESLAKVMKSAVCLLPAAHTR